MIHHLKLQRIGIVPAAKKTAPSGVANVAGPSFLPGVHPGEQVIELSEAPLVPNPLLAVSANLLASCSATACSTRSGRKRRPNNRSESPKNPHYFDSYHRRTPRRLYRFCRPGFYRSLPRQGVTPSVAAWRFDQNAAVVVEGCLRQGSSACFLQELGACGLLRARRKCSEILNP